MPSAPPEDEANEDEAAGNSRVHLHLADLSLLAEVRRLSSERCRERRPAPQALDRDAQERLWRVSLEMTGLGE